MSSKMKGYAVTALIALTAVAVVNRFAPSSLKKIVNG